MKTIWKVLIGAAAVAAVTPYKVEKDEESGAVKVTSVTWSVTVKKSGDDTNVTLNLLPLFTKKAEDGSGCGDDGCCCGEETESDVDITVEEVSETPEPDAPATNA